MNTRTDEIFVRKIKAYGYHGVFEKENREGQWFFVDLKMSVSLAEAAETDDLAKKLRTMLAPPLSLKNAWKRARRFN